VTKSSIYQRHQRNVKIWHSELQNLANWCAHFGIICCRKLWSLV